MQPTLQTESTNLDEQLSRSFMDPTVQVCIQALMIIIALTTLLFLHSLPKHFLDRRRRRQQNSTSTVARRHFIVGAQTLASARRQSPPSQTLIKSVINSADLAISLDPYDAAAHILKALALDLANRKVQALRSLDLALDATRAKSLGDKERADALIKRAELNLGVNKKRRVEIAIKDLIEAINIGERNGKALVTLGECYEMKGMMDDAKKTYQEAIKVDESLDSARKGLKRLL